VTDKDDAYLALAWGSMQNLIRQIKIGKALGVIAILRYLKTLLEKSKKEDTGLKDSLNIESRHIQFFSYKGFKNLLERSGLSIIKQKNRRFLSGHFSDRILSKSEKMINWNVKIADKIPYWLASSWMFVVGIKNK